ncbi:D-glycero-beta-D-manno-heptose-7-phosphate kinase [Candidatus Woesearchaeota archaeon]|nr:D-glycero-beta-D-manno-heptose-7-phosphate kinase [Candidatus Woesearchaeota archaeon]
MAPKLLSIIGKFRARKILIVGDLMLDRYILGDVTRINPEAPVPIVEVREERSVLGGAANVASNVVSLGAKAVLGGVIGKDAAGEAVLKGLREKGIDAGSVIAGEKKPTTQKVRVVVQNQQLLRIDYEKNNYVQKQTEEKLIGKIKSIALDADAIIISDYAKGTVTHALIEALRQFSDSKIIIVDPKPKHALWYHGFTLVTPNTKEAVEMAQNDEDAHIHEIGKSLMSQFGANILVTRGEFGMSLFEKDGKITDIPTKAKEVYDVSGAGDTVVAVLALAISSGASLEEAAIIANYAAGIKVGKKGTAPVSFEELKKVLEKESLQD